MCRNGDIFIAVLEEDSEGSLQSGIRPVLIVSNDKANKFSPVITIVPITSKREKRNLPTHVLIEKCGLSCPSVVLAEQITSINKSRLSYKMGSIRETVYEKRVRRAIEIQLNL